MFDLRFFMSTLCTMPRKGKESTVLGGGLRRRKYGTKATIVWLLLIILVVCVFVLFCFSKGRSWYMLNSGMQEQSLQLQESNSQSPIDEIKQEFSILKAQISDSQQANEQSVSNLQIEVENLRKEVELRDIYPYKVEILKVMLDIQNNVQNFKDYKADLRVLEAMTLPTSIEDGIKVLKKYADNNLSEVILFADFNSELNDFLKKSNVLNHYNNRFVGFLSQFIIIRNKIGKGADGLITTLEIAMNRRDYKTALHIFDAMDSLDIFPTTRKNLEMINALNETITNMISYLTNNGKRND